MALSPAHRLGQIIGEVLENATLPLLESFAKSHGLYLDKKGERPCRKGINCKWKDSRGNAHNLDFVLEKGGSPNKAGMPVAFIETAWRRYTKHSRNKVQEIQGAVVPLVETYRNSAPFMGAILGGVFTEGALTQLKSLGFTVLYFPYEYVVAVFKRFGLDVSSDENTPDDECQKKVDACDSLPESRRTDIGAAIMAGSGADVNAFIKSLAAAVSRQIERIIVLPLHGNTFEATTIDDAVKILEKYDEKGGGGPVERYEILIRYSNGDRIEATFQDREAAIKHLLSYQPIAAA